MQTITAPRSFSPGEVIFKEIPFIELLMREYKDDACESCFEGSLNLKSCKECLSVKYCSKTCQKRDWKNHRLECKNLKNLPSGEHTDLTRLIGNLILKIKDKDWKTIKINSILGRDVTFDDLEFNFERIPNTHRHLLCNSVKECVRRYIGDENMPNEDTYWKIFGKIQHSIFTARCKRPSTIRAFSVLIGVPLYQNECIPNCQLTRSNNVFNLSAIKKIEQSEKLSISRKDILNEPPVMGISYGQCNCTDCKLPYGESVLSKITDERKAFSVVTRSEDLINMWNSFPIIHGMPEMKYIVDDILQEQEGVLGETHALRLKLLVIKCFHIGGDPLEKKRNLLKLKKNVVAVFGEYYEELPRIYNALAEVCFILGDLTEGGHHFQKLIRFDLLMSQ